jgi:hypothetical protein
MISTFKAKEPKKPRLAKCKVCGGKYVRTRPLQSVCLNIACAVQHGRNVAAKKERREIFEKKKKLKSRSDYLKEAQQIFNAYRREIARVNGYPCISSGRPLDWSVNQVDAGHYRSIGSAPHLRFDERNVHAQSKHDNQFLSGNTVEYRKGLIERIGLEAVEALEADNRPRKFTIEELKAIKQEYKLKLKNLKAVQ